MHFPAACPEIPVAALAPALVYHRDQLGFAVDWSDDELGLAGLSRDDARLFMSDAGYRSGRGNRAPIVLWLNLSSRAEIDALHAEWQAAGAHIADAPAAKPYKLYEFFARDIDGNVLRVFYDFGWEEAGAAQP
ncbi:VOC family protein [Sphingosinicella sp.]|uniref:VOC family protein n=1 Tax=Sphingosinicella sp. TaxID=1917971 RepID=UPI004038347E